MSEELLYTPSNWGKLFHALPHNDALGAGSAGPGKSLVLLMDPLEQIVQEHNRCMERRHPYHLEWGSSSGWALHMRRTMPMLEQTISRSHKYFPKIDPDCTYDRQKHTWTFRSGYKYQFGHCSNADDWENYQSNEYSHIAFDELVQFDEEQFHNIASRLRTSDHLMLPMLKVRSCSNPFFKRESGVNIKIRDPHWVRKRYVDPAPRGGVTLKKTITLANGEKRTRTRIYLPATLFDNPDPTFVKNYEETLLDKPAHIRQAMLYGDWYVNPGSHYGDDWMKNVHVCRPFAIPGDWRRFRSMDWGYKSWGCIHWWAVDYDGNLICTHEFSFRMMDAGKVAKRVKEIEKGMGLWNKAKDISGISGPADTQLWEERGESGKTKAQEFGEQGVGWKRADKKSRARNSQRFLERLRDRKSMVPGVLFFETCENAIRTIPAIQTDPHDLEAPCEGGDDHWHDSVMYACAEASHKHAGTSRDRIVEREDEDPDPDVKLDRGKLGYGSRVE